MSNTHQWIPMETWFSDGIGKILFVTPSHGSKITGSHDGKEYRKSDKYWGGQKGCPMDSIDIHSSDGIKWSPSMSIGITRSVVVNLNSDNELTFRPLLMYFPSPLRSSEKYYSTRKYYRARKIHSKFLFERFYSTSNIRVHTNLALFYLWIWESQEIRYANFVALARSKESGESTHLIFVPSPTKKNANIRIHNWTI